MWYKKINKLKSYFSEGEINNIYNCLQSNVPNFLGKNDNKYFQRYGTAGFRGNAKLMDHVVFLSGVFISVLSRITVFKRKKEDENFRTVVFGSVVTASHNQECDNGIKIIMENGELLHHNLVVNLQNLVNSHMDFIDVREWINEIFHQLELLTTLDPYCFTTQSNSHWMIRDGEEVDYATKIIVGWDTRRSSVHLAKKFIKGTFCWTNEKSNVLELGLATTPQVQFLTKYYSLMINSCHDFPKNFYFNWFKSKFNSALKLLNNIRYEGNINRSLKYVGTNDILYVDGANGIGAHEFTNFLDTLRIMNEGKIIIINDGKHDNDILNSLCGSEYVYTEKKLPQNFENIDGFKEYSRCCSFDGDADRVVYFTWNNVVSYNGNDKSFQRFSQDEEACGYTYLKNMNLRGTSVSSSSYNVIVLGGERLAIIILLTVIKSCNNICEKIIISENEHQVFFKLNIGIIQTAYSNGGYVEYIKNIIHNLEKGEVSKLLHIQREVAKTGVKNLHDQAKKYDIGIYFESNGHGTTLVDFNRLSKWAAHHSFKTNEHYMFLESYLQIFNDSTGDAMTDVLAIEMGLQYFTI